MSMSRHFPDRRLAALTLAIVLGVAPGAAARAAEWRPSVALTGGFRLFGDELDLREHWSYGGRVGLSDPSRTTLYLDYLECRTWRNATARHSEIFALRALVRFDILKSTVRPYVIAGFGGMMLQFDDAPNAGVGAFTYGGGAEARLGDRWSIFAEGTFDTYTAERVTYTPGGTVYGRTYRGTFSMNSLIAGLSARF